MAGKHRGDKAPAEYSLELQDRRVRLSEQREARFQRAQAQREQRQAEASEDRAERRAASSSGSIPTPGKFARTVTQRSGTYSGKGTLAALLLVGFVIVGIRLVADAEVADDGTTVKAKVLHPQGELGPVPILAALIATFFVLSFVAIGGGLRAKLAVILGGAVILTLGVRSLNEIKFVASTFGKIGTITAPAPSGQLSSILDGGQTAPATSGIQGTITNIFNSLPNAPQPTPIPPGWESIPNTGEVKAKNGTCPKGWALAGDRCIPPLQSGPPAS